MKTVLGMGLFAVAASFLRSPEPKEVVRMDTAIDEEYGGEKARTSLTSTEGERICCTACNRN